MDRVWTARVQRPPDLWINALWATGHRSGREHGRPRARAAESTGGREPVRSAAGGSVGAFDGSVEQLADQAAEVQTGRLDRLGEQ